jgi:hypothetical protein
MKKEWPREPIKAEPLRQAGQSLGEEIDQLINDKVMTWLLALAMLFLAARVTPPSLATTQK